MAQEGSSCSGGGGGDDGGGVIIAKSSKKVKQKKVPQRGLGVAQLEKIRLEEQQKRESFEATSVAVDSSSDIPRSLYAQCPNFSSVFNPMSMPQPLVTSLPSPNVMYRHAPDNEIRHKYSVPILKRLNRGGEMGSTMILMTPEHRTLRPRLSNGEHDPEKQRLNHRHEFGFEAQTSLSLESNVPHRPHQFQKTTSLMVNSFSGILQSSILNSQLEPPSNQSSHSDNYTPLWLEEDKIVGVKRPYPFYIECPQAPSFHRNPCHASSLCRSDELVLHSNGYIEPRSKRMREVPPNSSHLHEATADKEQLSKDFLTLAPPAVVFPLSNSKHKQPLDGDDLLGQEYSGRQMHHPGPSGLVRQSFSFFPIKCPTDQSVSNENGEKAEAIDLNLKL